MNRHPYFLKLDIHKFFDSVDHGILKSQLRSRIKDPYLLRLLDAFIDHPVPWTEPGKCIPIGNLTSQYFANFYLSGLDHFIKEYLRIEGYVRFMDDLVLFADEKDTSSPAQLAGALPPVLNHRPCVDNGSPAPAPTSPSSGVLGSEPPPASAPATVPARPKEDRLNTISCPARQASRVDAPPHAPR